MKMTLRDRCAGRKETKLTSVVDWLTRLMLLSKCGTFVQTYGWRMPLVRCSVLLDKSPAVTRLMGCLLPNLRGMIPVDSMFCWFGI